MRQPFEAYCVCLCDEIALLDSTYHGLGPIMKLLLTKNAVLIVPVVKREPGNDP